jgi:hypothetical protein
MSKQIAALLLLKKVKKMAVKERNPYLIACLRRQGFVLEEIPIMPISPPEHDTCKICQSNSIIRSNHENICQQCGATDISISSNPFKTYKQDINFSKGSFIEPGSTFVNVIKDGKQVLRDLSKVNTWVSNDPDEIKMNNNMKKINEILETLSSSYNPVLFEQVKLQVLAMWYNILILKPDIRGNEKKALSVWSIYYPMVFNNLKISLQKLGSMFDIQIGEVYSYNFVIKDIFKNTPFQKYISIPVGTIVDIEIPEEIKRKYNLIIKSDLKNYLSSPLKDKEIAGIIYYIAKQLDIRAFTLIFLSEKYGISSVLIASVYKQIELYYKKNPNERAKIF